MRAPKGTFVVYRWPDGSIQVMELILEQVTIDIEPRYSSFWPIASDRRRITLEGIVVNDQLFAPGETPRYETTPQAEIEQGKLALDAEQGI